MIEVKLEWYECEQAIYVGARREAEAIRNGLCAPQFSDESSIENHMQSAGAERAVAKLLNLDWHASINTFTNGIADVGRSIEVRWRRKAWDLIVRDDDSDERYYVLVRGELPDYQIIGWIKSADAKQPQFRQNPGGHGEAWFVPEQHLRPVSELKISKVRPIQSDPGTESTESPEQKRPTSTDGVDSSARTNERLRGASIDQ